MNKHNNTINTTNTYKSSSGGLTTTEARLSTSIGWHYLSNATCLMRPHVFYVLLVASRSTIVCYILHHFRRKKCVRLIVLEKCFPLNQGNKACNTRGFTAIRGGAQQSRHR